MPWNCKPTHGSKKYATYSSEKLQKVLQDLKSGVLTQRQPAALYNIPGSALKNKLKGAHYRKYGGQPIFAQKEEK